jgi:precorrin-2 dehydrogenase/sirohydrochlorin ferrochelatase
MIPVFLDPASARIMLVGRGRSAVCRLAWLKDAGATPDVWSDAPAADLAAASAHLVLRLPAVADIERYHAIWIADLPAQDAENIARDANQARVLVNVEDAPSLCNFHSPAVVRRGKLTLAAGTGGASPAVSRVVRERLETVFPATWETVLDEIAAARIALRGAGAKAADLAADARARLSRRGLV